MWGHCERTEPKRIHGLLTAPWIWNYFGCCCLWLCHVKGEARREQARTNTVCSMLVGPGMGSAWLLNIRAHKQFPSWDGSGATEVATLTRNNQKGSVTGAGRGRHYLLSKEIQFACFPSPPPSLKGLPCPQKAWSVTSINEDLRKKVSNQLILWLSGRILNIF